MYFVCNYVNITGTGSSPGTSVPLESIRIISNVTDPLATAAFDVWEQTPTISLQPQQSIVIIDETGLANPTHNFICNAHLDNPISVQYGVVTPAGITITGLTPGAQVVTNNAANGVTGYLSQNMQAGYIIPGQTYVFSIYETITVNFTGAQAMVKFDFLDAYTNVISGSWQVQGQAQDFRSTTGGVQQRIVCSATAPANAASIQVVFGVQTSNATNSGTVQYQAPQLECKWFGNDAVSYPTPDCNSATANSTVLPDGTIVRQTRKFAGVITKCEATYQGKTKIWTITCASNSYLLETFFLVNTNYTSSYDSGIITGIVNANYTVTPPYPGSGNAATFTIITTNNVIQGALIDYITITDITTKELLATLSNSSGYYYYVDYYFDLHYCPPGYEQAQFGLFGNDSTNQPNSAPTDGTLPTYAYYAYKWMNDGTQIKDRVKVFGGKFLAPQITDTLTGIDGVKKDFLLSQQPFNVTQVKRDGVDITTTTGVTGVQTLGVGGIVATYDKAAPKLHFQTAPTASGSITYTYESNAIVRVRALDSIASYNNRIYDSKVNDTALNSITAATQRGLAELVQYSQSRVLIQLTTQQALSAGQSVQFTSTYDNLTRIPMLVQRVEITAKGNSIYEYKCDLGAYNPDLVSILVNIHKVLLRNPTTAGQVIVQENLAAVDTLYVTEKITATVIGTHASSTYSVGIYGTSGWG